MDLYLATCVTLPEPDPDAAPLLSALARRGIDATLAAWDDPAVDWSRARATLLRSTWNYPRHADAFLAWAERVATVAKLWNPIDVVRRNLHKRYLLDLESAGIPTAPTILLARGERTTLADVVTARGWETVVVKPAISAASYRTMRVEARDRAKGEAHLRALLAERDVLVQRYLPSVEEYGERALVWVDGEVTHAIRKTPRFSGQSEAVSSAVPVARREEELALRAVATIGAPLLYARIDMAPGLDGEPVIMELELIEPSLFFAQGPEALTRLVDAVARRLG